MTTPSVDLSETQAPGLAAVIILGVTLGAITVALRIYTRAVIVRKVFLNDYCIIAGLVAAVGMAICMGISLLNGFGRHAAAITPQQITAQLKVGIGGVFFYHCSHMLIKSSILLQYIRICVFSFERRICYIAIVIVVAEGLSWIICLFLTCIPFRAMWTPNVPGARCIDNTVSFYVCAGMLISADVAILAIPAFLLRHSLLPWRRKLLLGAVLALGGAAIIASILRVRVIYESTNATDKAWEKAPNAILGAIEVDLGLICSCIVTLMPLLSRYLPASWVNWYGHEGVLEVGKLSSGSGDSDRKPDNDVESGATPGKMDAEKKVGTAAYMQGKSLA